MTKKIALAGLILGFIPGCMQLSQKPLVKRINLKTSAPIATSIDATTNFAQNPPITIWIHGTRLLPKGMFQKFFYSKPGLHHYATIDPKFHLHKIAATLSASDPYLFPAQTFYLFGWSGMLSFKEREIAARRFYDELKLLRLEYVASYGHEPEIRIICHSHGGNIALLLEKVKDPADVSFFVKDLILLACPVQTQTMEYASAPLFGKVYSLYSILDVMQVVDPQGLQKEDNSQHVPLFSQRFFPHNEKIEQVAIKKNDRSLMHIEFVQLQFLAQIPQILAEIESWHTSTKAPDWHCRDKCLCINTKSANKFALH
jgi:hypothetical protein